MSYACGPVAYAQDTVSDVQEAVALEQINIFGQQEPYFEKARSTALKTETRDLETPFTTTVINAAVLEDLKATTLEEAYSYIPGLSRSGVTANGFTIRGFAADLQNVQVDGLPGLVSRMGATRHQATARVVVARPQIRVNRWAGMVTSWQSHFNSRKSSHVEICNC